MEIQNSVTLQGQIDGTNFADLDKIINVCNQIWQKQEYQRRKKKQEEDSLYLTKYEISSDIRLTQITFNLLQNPL